MTRNYRHLAIVGGGATGVSAFMAAVKNRVATSIFIIDPRPIGGMVFGTSDNDIMCNTPVDVTSIDTAYSTELFDYLASIGYHASESTFIPRRVVGNYIRHNFERTLNEARVAGIYVAKVDSSCSSIRTAHPGHYELMLADNPVWGSITATDVILCSGHGSPKVPPIFEPLSGHPSFFRSPYPEGDMLAKMPANAEVLIIGSKQSAVDAALLLCREGHRVTMISPSGELPSVRTGFAPIFKFPIGQKAVRELMSLWRPDDVYPDIGQLRVIYLRHIAKNLKRFSDIPFGTQISKSKDVTTRLHEEVDIANNSLCKWEDLIFSYVDAVNNIYFSRSEYAVSDIEPSFRKEMMRYVTSASLPNAKKILKYLEGNVLAVKRGSVTSVQTSHAGDKAWEVKWGSGEGRFDAVVCAVGFHNHRYYFDDAGALVLDDDNAPQAIGVDIAPDLSIRNPRTREKENIWITGSGTHHRILTSSAVALTIPQVQLAIDSMSDNYSRYFMKGDVYESS